MTTPENLPDSMRNWIIDGIRKRATDLHLDPDREGYRLAMRVDGILSAVDRLDLPSGAKLINQIKVAGNLAPDFSPEPVEGQFQVDLDGKTHSFRLTVMPTVRREALHLRRLTPASEILSPENLGLAENDLKDLRRTLTQPEGLILTTGPTGSGKTMTVYSLLTCLDLDSLIAISIEDPVEYDLPNIRQVQVDAAHGLDFARGLEAILRMDPDVVVVGEIRDEASALTAIRAAASGRFVIASLHATDAPGILDSLTMLGIRPGQLASVLRFAFNQQLIRTLCPECKGSRDATDADKAWFDDHGLDAPDTVPVAVGCDRCGGGGYYGRTGVFETICPDEETRSIIASHRASGPLREHLHERKHAPLITTALKQVLEGRTTLEEALGMHSIVGDEADL